MKNSLIVLFLLLVSTALQAQSTVPTTVVDKKKHKVVIQLTSGDTLVQKAMLKQIANLLTAAPNTKVEVVCHSNGIGFLQSAATRYGEKIHSLGAMGVDFVACENSMREHKIKKEDLVKGCRTVPAGILEVIQKQEQHWAYLKAGF